MNKIFPTPFKYAIAEAKKSDLRTKVGAALVVGKSILKGHNKNKTHPEFANPEKHIRKSLHAELDCILRMDAHFIGGDIYVYREVDEIPAMARPCEHCMEFLRKHGINKIYYSISKPPYWRAERI